MDTSDSLLIYTPVLKVKSGELAALSEVRAESKENILPLFEIMPIPWDYVNDKPGKTIDGHLNGVVEQIQSKWGGAPYLLDLPFLDDEDLLEDNNHPLAFLADQARQYTPYMIPVTGLDRSDSYNNALTDVLGKLHTGLTLRLRGDDFDNDDIDINIEDVVKKFELEKEDVDIIVDLGSLPQEGYTPYIAGIRSLLRMIPDISSWRRLILISSSFPESLVEIPAGKAKLFSRGEWLIWKSIVEKGRIKRLPSFGDYTVVHPQPFDMDPRLMRLGAKVKYTTEESWAIVKGYGIKKKGYGQFRELAAAIMNSKFYCGESFSYGDKYIKDCANGAVGTGNQTTWVKVGVNHHLEFVVRQLSMFSGS